jgi:hypothetical protein
VNQKTAMFTSAPNNDFIILQFNVINRTTSTISNLYLGFYLDFDIHSESPVWYDHSVNVPASDWAYMWETGATTPRFSGYVGIVGIPGADRGSVVDNAVYIYPEGMGWDDTVKYNLMTGAFSAADGSPAQDWSVILSEGPFTLTPLANHLWAVAVVAGNNLPDWQNNANTARTIYPALGLQDDIYLPEYSDIQIYPNPFNAACRISLNNSSAKIIEIFDLSGRLIKTIEIATGSKQAIWDGMDSKGSPLPTGIYFIKVETEHRASKAILIR